MKGVPWLTPRLERRPSLYIMRWTFHLSYTEELVHKEHWLSEVRPMIKRLSRFLLGSALVLTVFYCPAPARPGDGAVHPEMIVSAQWLAEHLNDPKVVVLHVGDKRSEYANGHIPGARFLALEDFIEGEDAELPSTEKLKAAFEKVGVSDDSRVIIYTTAWYPMAGRAYYTLDYLGHGDHTALLDGGIDEWRAEKRPLANDEPKIARGSFTPHVHPEVRAMMEEVKKISEQPSKTSVLVDARPEKRYIDGHIAGATHVYWQETLVDARNKPVFLPADKLKELFTARGITTGQKLVTYCEIGLQASHDYFIAKYLGYDAAMFDGSIHQWSHVNMLPVVAGKSVR
jgi:thiosulfate/3-mercaptopyruvate sulfurtransferase